MSEHDAGLAESVSEFPAIVELADSFVDESYLTYFIPSMTDFDLEAAFSDYDRTRPILDSIPQRSTLFFDETVDVLLVLKTPWLPRQELDSHINRLVLSLEAHVVNSNVPSRDSNTITSESIFSGRLKDVADPFIIVEDEGGTDAVGEDGEEEEQQQQEEEEEPEREEEYDEGAGTRRFIYAMWKFPILLARPRMRLSSPSVVFSASAGLSPETGGDIFTPPGSGYLPSGLPSGLNLLESFGGDPTLNGIRPRLSALRVSRVSPVTRQQDLMTRLRALPQLSLRVFPVLHTRIRFSRSTTIPPSSAVIALLEIDFTPHLRDCDAFLEDITLSTAEGTVDDLSGEAGLRLPLRCVSHDHVTFLYHIRPHGPDSPNSGPRDSPGTLDIAISASVNAVPGLCRPRLAMSWNTALEFSHPDVAAAAAASASASATTAPAPTASNRSSQVIKPLQPLSAIRPDALPALEARASPAAAAAAAPLSDLGITMSFTAPSRPIHPGDIFSWTVYVVNRSTDKSSSRPPRKLAFVAVPKRRRPDPHARSARALSTGVPPSSRPARDGDEDIADAVMDENVLHALQKSAAIEAMDLICLSTDTRVGPVAPGACHVVELQFLALREGILGLEAIRVVDLNSQEHVDIRDLPTTIVTPVAA
ncbi:hypothetical protein ESCO_000844 [Escovopsis weberi]|uniref:Trafficking protein particle complex II-specific subunit 65 IgD3 domain-containing protein n=1 Tax=Escovopsis weberi TaxID=150374 RepID=A0A0M8MUS0_ESCWE|nr:hypothetical protein ESCO_000844 [Escovopsis weberi]